MTTMEEDPELAEMRGIGVPGAAEYIGFAGAGAPMVFHYSNSSSTSLNGVVTSTTFVDYVALGGGALAVLCGLVSFLLLPKTAPTKKSLRRWIAIGLVCVGAFQLVRGFGLLGA